MFSSMERFALIELFPIPIKQVSIHAYKIFNLQQLITSSLYVSEYMIFCVEIASFVLHTIVEGWWENRK